ncbi:hypothetical protein [Streptococcus sanguinis]|jgi:hypothetical protein|uniref:hypothetical protein n=1 Tax=Streptococcus sanguinis TaxID=1305 RepID=UPI0007791337|nr:hypothetical protein [Streptococcus sanguinis]RKW00986.1 MAG: hypothetical protein D8H99_16630 [Streptococcus sp.]
MDRKLELPLDILSSLEKNVFYFKYKDNFINVNLTEFLHRLEDDSILFIDIISDFYYVQALYELSTGEEVQNKSLEIISKNRDKYDKLLTFIRFYYLELIECAKELKIEFSKVIDRYTRYLEHDIFGLYIRQLDYMTSVKYNCYQTEGFLSIRCAFMNRVVKYQIPFSSNSDLYENIADFINYLITSIQYSPNNINKFQHLVIILKLLLYGNESVPLGKPSSLEIDEFNVLHQKFQEELSSISESRLKYVSPEISDEFGKIINRENYAKELHTKEINKKKFNCYAVAYDATTKYYAINYFDKNDDLHKKFQKLLGNEYIPAKITNDVRYYLQDKRKYITYEQFEAIKLTKDFNRMFSCCERKLFAKFRDDNKLDGKMNLIVTKKPCEYCSRELDVIENKGSLKINLKVPTQGIEQGQGLLHKDIEKHDTEAKKIWGNNLKKKLTI